MKFFVTTLALSMFATAAMAETAPTTAPAQTATAAAPAAATTTTTAAEVKPAATRAWKVEYLNQTVAGIQALHDVAGTDAIDAYNMIGFKYSLGNGVSVGIREQFNYRYSFAEKNEAGAITKDSEVRGTNGDAYLYISKSKLFTFANDGFVTGVARIYLPTGEAARNTENHGYAHGRLIANKPLNSAMSLNYHLYGTWYNQTQNFYHNGTKQVANSDYRVLTFGEFSWDLNKSFSFGQALGTDNAWKRPIPGKELGRSHMLYIDTNITWNAMDNLGLTLGLEQDTDIYRPEHSFHIMRGDETSAYFVLNASI